MIARGQNARPDRTTTKRPITSWSLLPRCFRDSRSCKIPFSKSLKSGAPDKIRTCDLCLRRATSPLERLVKIHFGSHLAASTPATTAPRQPEPGGRLASGRNLAPERQEGGAPPTEMRGHRSRHSEISANLLYPLRSHRRDFSECVLIDNANYLDFDSSIRRFESSRPSQPVWFL